MVRPQKCFSLKVAAPIVDFGLVGWSAGRDQNEKSLVLATDVSQ